MADMALELEMQNYASIQQKLLYFSALLGSLMPCMFGRQD